ncbi:MAG: type IV toxin-antitoxin system AbiEi family antitoxin domain-containing protein [Candidatus Delongbacteria bacterium]|jgi:predicted transcriptional regulator of viral defense system|nr:type IV toxin-antitoxin system AbiEi family antitoxin domain-containing protein [Candidatus Delongbacteria bacterium]
MYDNMKIDAVKIFKKNGGQLRMAQAIKLGISRYKLYSLRDKGVIELVARGIYRLRSIPSLSSPDIQTVCYRVPRAVIFLISALSFHDMTTQIPHEVSIAVPVKSRAPSIDYPPVKVYHLKSEIYSSGIVEHVIDGITVKVYDPEKTLVDSFRYRNKIGLDVAIEALKFYRQRGRMNLTQISKYAKICRVDKIMQPYLEAVI